MATVSIEERYACAWLSAGGPVYAGQPDAPGGPCAIGNGGALAFAVCANDYRCFFVGFSIQPAFALSTVRAWTSLCRVEEGSKAFLLVLLRITPPGACRVPILARLRSPLEKRRALLVVDNTVASLGAAFP